MFTRFREAENRSLVQALQHLFLILMWIYLCCFEVDTDAAFSGHIDCSNVLLTLTLIKPLICHLLLMLLLHVDVFTVFQLLDIDITVSIV